MLALRAIMDPLRPSPSYSAPAPDLLRQPSAEDLDAAHQLVSSARGRNGEYSGHERRTSLLADENPARATPRTEDESRGGHEYKEPTQESDGSSLGQMCR